MKKVRGPQSGCAMLLVSLRLETWAQVNDVKYLRSHHSEQFAKDMMRATPKQKRQYSHNAHRICGGPKKIKVAGQKIVIPWSRREAFL